MVGSTVILQNRTFHIYDCDAFTANYLGLSPEGGKTGEKNRIAPDSIMTPVPPHTIEQIGDPIDSMQNCLRLQPKAPKKDLKKFIKFSGKVKKSFSFQMIFFC